MEKILQSRLVRAVRHQRGETLCWHLAACWSLAAAAGYGCRWAQDQLGWASAATAPALAALAALAGAALVWRGYSAPPDYRALARKIERRHPELNGLLLTAVQQEAGRGEAGGYLRQRLIQQAVDHSRAADWRRIVPPGRFRAAAGLQWAALAVFLFSLVGVRNFERAAAAAGAAPRGITVTPGDTSLERGESLVVLARFGGALPPEVTLVLRRSGAAPQQMALVKSLADPVFGLSIPEVDHDLTYRLDYGRQSTREFKVAVFERPRLERADAQLTYPSYTRQAPRRIENTRRITAVEGTHLDLTLQLNKPVASATLVAHDTKKTVIPLHVAADKAVATLPGYVLAASQIYDLRLVDRDGRSNPQATPLVIDVLPNRPPELQVSTPRGDLRPSAIEEINFAGTVRGEFGVSAYGLAYTPAGGQETVIALGQTVPPAEKRPFASTLRLEDLGVQPDELISWYVWADDIGPDGQRRRTTGDLYFAEIRPFDEIFRESQAMQSPDDAAGNAGGQGNPGQRLAELQKQIIGATWKLQREGGAPKYPDDAKVVGDGQNQALTQAGSEREKAEDPRARALWTAVTQQMDQALGQLHSAAQTPDRLPSALVAEEGAYQALLRLQSRDTRVSRGRSGAGGGRGEAGQRQLDQLDLSQEQNRYETQRQAAPTETPERREQLQVMNRLQELARRQQEVNDRLKEMQTALQEAKSAPAREDLRRQLKRLQEEQQQVLADADELRQRLDQQADQSNLSEQRQQLQQTRDEVERAGELAAQGQVSEALAAGTRAQRQFQDMRDQLRQQNSSQFADDLREMRTQARELAEHEAALAAQLAPNAPAAARKRLSDAAADSGPAGELDDQKRRMADLVNRAKQVSQQAEATEPLLAEKLYDSLRQLTQDDTGTVKEFQQQLLNSGLLTRGLNDRMNDAKVPEGTKALDLTTALLQEGYRPQAAAAEQRARTQIDDFKAGVEQAAQSVIGDDTAALRLAQAELDSVTDDLKTEAARTAGTDPADAPGRIPARSETDQSGAAIARQEQSVREHPDDAQAHRDLGAALRAAGREAEGKAQADQAAQLAMAQGQGLANPGVPATAAAGQAAAQNRTAAAGANGPAGGNRARRLAEGNAAGAAGGGPGVDPLGLDRLVNGGGAGRAAPAGDPITGSGYGAWSDRLRDVEEIVDAPDLRNTVAAAREQARLLRQDYTRNLKRPDWAIVQSQVVKPLLEVRDQISDELARRQSKDSLVPIDRDPVPSRYAESVRKYYEELGKDK